VAHVQRAGRVGGDELHQHALGARRPAAKGVGIAQHLGHHRLLRSRLQAQIDEAGPGDLHVLHPALHCGLLAQLRNQRLRQLARVLLQRTRQRHGGRDGQIAVGGNLGRLEGTGEPGARSHLCEHCLQCLQQLLLGLDHAAILLLAAASHRCAI
jgi:hypothetical protein